MCENLPCGGTVASASAVSPYHMPVSLCSLCLTQCQHSTGQYKNNDHYQAHAPAADTTGKHRHKTTEPWTDTLGATQAAMQQQQRQTRALCWAAVFLAALHKGAPPAASTREAHMLSSIKNIRYHIPMSAAQQRDSCACLFTSRQVQQLPLAGSEAAVLHT